MSHQHVRIETGDGIARIVLDRPPVNALSLDFIRSVVAAFRQIGGDPAVRAVILTSAVSGRFSAGLDLDILIGKSGMEVREFLTALYVDLYDAQHDLGRPSIASVSGTARGGGVTMAISCDVLIAAESATFGYPEIDIGVLPAIHFAHLPRIIGRHRAFELLFTGRSFTAREAAELGLVSRVVADADLDAAASAMARTFAAKSDTVMRLGRAAFMRQNDLDYRRSIAAAVEDFCNVVATDAAQEGLRAFVEKRRPRW
ncbi:enoyl-CoA hydratase/isomerase family protein [Phreatobacter sp.]|uniref:enoyl-CoA hydratase/isomerase family protein n=1 Tax=Phreatobacter sp. TaxID=1966341 RepID=UPI003F6EEF06